MRPASSPLRDSGDEPPVARGEGAHGLLRALGGSPSELGLGAAAAIASMIFIGRLARDFWFRFDIFFFLADRRVGSLDDWFRPHAGHWVTWTMLLFRGLYATFGMDYWPWYYLPRLVGHAALAFLFWRVMLHRGADRLIAAGAYAALLVLAISYFHDALTVGNYVVFGGLAIAALLLSEVDNPAPRHLALMAGCLVAGVMGNGYGVAVLLGVVVVAAGTRRFRRWAPSLLLPLVVYGAWYLWYRPTSSDDRAPLSPRTAIEAIQPSLVVLRTAVENTLGLPKALAALVLALTAGLLFVSLVRRRLDVFDAVIAATLLFVLAILAMARTVVRAEGATEDRYGYAVVLLLVLLVVPHLRAPTRRAGQVVLALVLVAVVAFNAVSLQRRLNGREVVAQTIRVQAETTAALIADGEPFVSYAKLGLNVRVNFIARLVEDGWLPQPSTDPAVIDTVRAGMRIAVPNENVLQHIEPGVAPEAAGVGDDGCLEVGPSSVADLRVTEESAITVEGDVTITWTDRFGTASRTVRDAVVGLAEPVGETTVTVEAIQDEVATVCSLRPLSP